MERQGCSRQGMSVRGLRDVSEFKRRYETNGKEREGKRNKEEVKDVDARE